MMNFDPADLFAILPEILVLTGASIILILEPFQQGRDGRLAYWLSQLTLLAAAISTLSAWGEGPRLAFNGAFITDAMGDVLKVAMYFFTAAVFLYSRDYLVARGLGKGEYYVLGLFGLMGMMVLVSAHSLLTIYLGLELLSLSLYAMVAFDRDSGTASEAAMKYFVLGAIASGMLLYGMSMLYGTSGSLDIAVIGDHVARVGVNDLVVVFGLVFVVVGIGFKLGAVPFHMWIPDVYHGAPTSVTLYIGSIPKLAAFALVMRLLVEGMGGAQADWQDMLVILAVLSMVTGNLIAIAQTNIKRMLAYSTIAHMGFLLLGFAAGTPEGYSAAMFYTLIYALMALGAFGMVIFLSRSSFEADRIEDFRGLNDRSPWFAFIMLLLMFSMAGVPPTAGFYAKLSVLAAVVEVDMVWLAAVAVFFSIIGVFYYLRVVKMMYFDKIEESAPLESTLDMRVVVSANGLAVLALGIYPAGLMSLCLSAIANG